METISFEQFKDIELRIATIKTAERIEKSNKLVRLEIDAGEEDPRQLVAGIAKAYDPDNLAGRQIVIVANLEPKELFGVTSHGMLLAASDEEGNPILLTPDSEVDPGAPVS